MSCSWKNVREDGVWQSVQSGYRNEKIQSWICRLNIENTKLNSSIVLFYFKFGGIKLSTKGAYLDK